MGLLPSGPSITQEPLHRSSTLHNRLPILTCNFRSIFVTQGTHYNYLQCEATDKSCVLYLRVQIVTFFPLLSLLVFVEANPVIKVNALISINIFFHILVLSKCFKIIQEWDV